LLEPLVSWRLSDGTLKFLCLLAVLLEKEPPPLICIEEPEVGLHPEAIQIVAEALVDASERTQLVVTTHSEALIDALSDRPEDVLVTERDFENGTQFRRLDSHQLSVWLERYTLGALWRKGEIGGNRW
jgi:predicted ATPase